MFLLLVYKKAFVFQVYYVVPRKKEQKIKTQNDLVQNFLGSLMTGTFNTCAGHSYNA